MDLFTSPSEDEEMWLRELAMSSMEDIEMQKSDLMLATTHYEVKPRIIKLVARKPFRGVEDDNPYRHINEFTMICNTVHQEGVPAAWFK
jgi:ribonucleotide reductase beta subunit family protein with ferritin-like domain